MADVIVGRKTQGQHVSVIIRAELFVYDGLLGEREKQVVGEWRVIERAVKITVGRWCAAGNRVRKSVCVAGNVTNIFPRRSIRTSAFQVFGFRQQALPARAIKLVGGASVV